VLVKVISQQYAREKSSKANFNIGDDVRDGEFPFFTIESPDMLEAESKPCWRRPGWLCTRTDRSDNAVRAAARNNLHVIEGGRQRADSRRSDQ